MSREPGWPGFERLPDHVQRYLFDHARQPQHVGRREPERACRFPDKGEGGRQVPVLGGQGQAGDLLLRVRSVSMARSALCSGRLSHGGALGRSHAPQALVAPLGTRALLDILTTLKPDRTVRLNL